MPVTCPERELYWCYYSPFIFLASSQTVPAPAKLFWHSCKIAARNGKRLISMILRKNRGLWTVYHTHWKKGVSHLMKVLVVYIVSFYPCFKIHFPFISNSLSEITIRLPFRIFLKKIATLWNIHMGLHYYYYLCQATWDAGITTGCSRGRDKYILQRFVSLTRVCILGCIILLKYLRRACKVSQGASTLFKVF